MRTGQTCSARQTLSTSRARVDVEGGFCRTNGHVLHAILPSIIPRRLEARPPFHMDEYESRHPLPIARQLAAGSD